MSAASRAVIDKATANRTNWRKLVRKVGPALAIEHVETAGMMGLVSAAESGVDVVMKSYGYGMWDADQVRGDLDALDAGFEERAVELHDAVLAISSCDESAAVAVYGLGYYADMFEVAATILGTGLTDEIRDEWSSVMSLWDRTCDAWDSVSGRNSLPLVAD